VRILLVEDEAKLAAYVKRGLEREGFAVDIAGDGEQGLWLASSEPYDVIVLDIMLPKLNGFRVCAELRQRQVWIPILMLTAKDGEFDEAEALDTGADDFLSKPFSFVVLLARLRALIRRGTGERPVVMVAGDLRLDPSQRRVFVGDHEVELTPTEFCVLQQLMRQPGDVLSKRDILGSCWDWAFEGDPNIVEVYVRRLRTKIDIPFGRTCLQTVRGAGYRLNVDDA
jgi:two-component system OmpR family response regulator